MGKLTLGADLYSWFYRVFVQQNERNAFKYNLKGFYVLFYLLILIIHSRIGESMGMRDFGNKTECSEVQNAWFKTLK